MPLPEPTIWRPSVGLFERVPYQDHPPRAEDRLTDKGRDLWQVVGAVRQWGDHWAAPKGAFIEHPSRGLRTGRPGRGRVLSL